jgi:UDP-N-acetylmuramoyl-L-alanyl-D-glutamate--2,6-diaminopimelate ligase
MNKILVLIKKIIPQPLFRKIQPSYHLVLNWLAGVWYGFPSEKLTVVGITGTTGKTTTVFMTAELLRSAGLKVGYTSTAMFSDGKSDWLNDKKMTMLGRFFTQRMLRQMVKNGCQVAIVETTSEGIVQNRHRFINYDIVEFTGLYPEHIDSHGSFENYKNAKLKLFEHFSQKLKVKSHKGKIKKTIIANLDDKYAKEFLNFAVERKIGFFSGKSSEKKTGIQEGFKSKNQNLELVGYRFLEMNKIGTKFVFAETEIQLKILGEFNALNATAAGCVGRALGIDDKEIKRGLEKIKSLPGRLERVEEGQNFMVIVDYAFEPVAVTKLYETVKVLKPNRIIHILGSTGGGRDLNRREKLGRIAGEKADMVIVTNEDPYDDDPMEIIKAVAKGVKKVGKIKNENLFLIEDRQEAIKKAVSLARENDLILLTGKGSEQAIAVKNGELLPWDDREAVREELRRLKNKN